MPDCRFESCFKLEFWGFVRLHFLEFIVTGLLQFPPFPHQSVVSVNEQTKIKCDFNFVRIYSLLKSPSISCG